MRNPLCQGVKTAIGADLDLVESYRNRRVDIREQLLAAVGTSGYSDRKLSMLATGSPDTIRNLRRGAAPRADTLEALCEVLGLDFRIGPRGAEPSPGARGRLSQPDEDDTASAPRPLAEFSDSLALPVRDWADGRDGSSMQEAELEPEPVPAPKGLADPQAFYVRALGPSMLQANIWKDDYCLVSPCAALATDRLAWFRNRSGAQTVRWVMRVGTDAFDLGSWGPADDFGHQELSVENWPRAEVVERGPVLAVYRGRPSVVMPPHLIRDWRPGPTAELWRSVMFDRDERLRDAVKQVVDAVSAVGRTEMRIKLLAGKGEFSDSQRELLLRALEEKLEYSLQSIRSSVEQAQSRESTG